MMQQLEEALTMLADRGEDLPIETVISRLEAELGTPMVVPEDQSSVGENTIESGLWPLVSPRRRALRPAWTVALAAVVVVLVVTGATWLFGMVGGDPADVSATTTTVVNRALSDAVRVSFDGTQCTVEGPSSLAAGTIVPLVLTNTSGSGARAHIARLENGHLVTGEERKFEDFVELQAASGGSLVEDPANLIDSPANWLRIEPVSFNRAAYWPTRALDDNQTLKVHRLSNELGIRVVYVTGQGTFDPEHRYSPDAYWFCAPLEVTPIEF